MTTSVVKRFCKYVQFHTTSDENSSTVPSTSCQLDFAKFLLQECETIGLTDIIVDKNGYIFATLPKNCNDNVPVIGFISHMDTSPDALGLNIFPKITENYQGQDIILGKTILSPKEFPSLLSYQGDSIITSDGTTLLGADDKAGISEILTAMEYLAQHPEIQHGEIRIAFTPDEEIGRGADYFDVNAFGSDFAYTIDGGQIGELEYENFNAARVDIAIQGKSVHPGTAKNAMINASLVGTELISALPPEEIPSKTEGYEGFYHLCHFDGTVSKATLSFIIRDFDAKNFEARKQKIKSIIAEKNLNYPNSISYQIHDQYHNMESILKDHMYIVELAKKAMLQCQIPPKIQPIRGGTDGARLSFMGLPCPNLFTGGHNFHGPYEYIPISSMNKAVEVIVAIASLAPNMEKL